MAKSNGYVWDAKDYAKNSANQFAWAQELIPKLKLKGTEALLDIGCGDGKVTAEIAKALPRGRVVGVDSSEEMIKLAQANFPQKAHANLSFQLMDARKLTFNEEFDKVFSNAALHWVVDQAAVLEGVQRSLQTGGRLLFQMAGKGNAQDVLDIIDELLTGAASWKRFFDGFTFPYAFLSPEEYRTLLAEAGLTPLRVEIFPKDMKFTGAEGLAGWVRTTWLPFTERIPIEQRDSFVKEIVNRYLKRYSPDAQGVVHLRMIRLEVEARKPA
ncbi:MAG: methyltransferase domain-containing protein [Candidatus Bathyarchaeota archaeon]|nr:methyltransferase domain-containing protein [Candidatus Bathyarchaeota archaeon]